MPAGPSGRKAEAQQVLEELIEIGKHAYVQPAYLGFIHATLGNHDEAFACFAQGIEHENASVTWIREFCIFAGLDDLRADPRFPRCSKKSDSKHEHPATVVPFWSLSLSHLPSVRLHPV